MIVLERTLRSMDTHHPFVPEAFICEVFDSDMKGPPMRQDLCKTEASYARCIENISAPNVSINTVDC